MPHSCTLSTEGQKSRQLQQRPPTSTERQRTEMALRQLRVVEEDDVELMVGVVVVVAMVVEVESLVSAISY